MRKHSSNHLITRIRQRVRKYIHDPALSPQDALVKEILFYWSFFTFLGTIGGLVITLILHAYPMVVFSYTMIGLIILILIRYGTGINLRIAMFIELSIAILMALFFSGWMGGPLDSGGLIFIGVYCILLSAPFRDMKMTIGLTAIYIIGLVILIILDPYLDTHPAMTPMSNYIMFLVKLIWLTTVQVVFLVYYFNESNQYELREKRRLEELDQTKNRLFTNISHEIRTPVTLILGNTDLIQPPDKKAATALNTIRNNGNRILRLVNQILSLTKLESSKVELNLVQSDIIRFVNFIVHMFQSLAETRDIQLKFHSFTDSFIMDFDPERIEEIMSNLISNAIRFNRHGGMVKVEVNLSDDFESSGKQAIRIKVIDNGVGIPADKLDLVFDRYYQADQHLKHHQEGSGIGLTLVRENILLMGGTVGVHSSEGIGTTFEIKLPVHRSAPVQSVLEPSLRELYPLVSHDRGEREVHLYAQNGHKAHLPLLLVVEDHVEMVDYIRTLLEGAYRIISAANGIAGLDLAMESIPDIIISDVMMPEMDGFEFLEKLKNEIRTSHIPVIMLTAKADMPSKLEGLEAGAEAYLTKPFDKHELKIRLRSILDQRARLQKKYLSSILSDHIPDLNRSESAFKKQLHEILLANLDNPEFRIEDLARQTGMSRTQLYKKVKALTNTTVDKYIRKFRLHQAVQLLKTTDLNVGQVALEVGIPNQSYFSRAFREEFGHSPREVTAVS